jgi:hypothetical protein
LDLHIDCIQFMWVNQQPMSQRFIHMIYIKNLTYLRVFVTHPVTYLVLPFSSNWYYHAYSVVLCWVHRERHGEQTKQTDTSHLAVYLGCCDILAVERLAALLIYILDGLECCQREAVAGEA